MKKRIFLFSSTLLLFLSATAQAEDLSPRLTADVQSEGKWSVGLFNPLRYAITDKLELETHPLYLFLSPNAELRYQYYAPKDSSLRMSAEFGVSVPTPALGMAPPFGLQSYFTPSCLVAAHDPEQEKWCQSPGWFLMPSLGTVASYGTNNVYTLALDLAVGVHLSGEKMTPLDAFTPLDLLFAPATRGFRAHLGGRYDHLLMTWLRASIEVDFYLLGAGPAPGRSGFIAAGHLGLDARTSEHTRVTLGTKYFNADLKEGQIEIDQAGVARLVHVRSNHFYPTVDFIWNY